MDLLGTPVSEIQSLIMQEKLLITREAYNELHYMYAPDRLSNVIHKIDISSPVLYKKITEDSKASIKQSLYTDDDSNISLTTEYDSTELPEGTLAYHRIVGPVMSDSWWWFSTTQFEQDFLLAESNPQISGHFIFCNSPGGDAYYLDRVSETIRNRKKPLYVLIKKVCCSAAYYICCHGDIVKSITQNDTIGSIGTMISFLDWDSYYKKNGLNRIEYKATKSILKNKKIDDLIAGKPKQFIEEELDPINEQFINEVKSSRKLIKNFDDSNPVLAGETFRASIAMTSDCGLIDGISTLPDAIKEAYNLGQKFLQNRRASITKLI